VDLFNLFPSSYGQILIYTWDCGTFRVLTYGLLGRVGIRALKVEMDSGYLPPYYAIGLWVIDLREIGSQVKHN